MRVCPYISHKHRGAQPTGLHGVEDVRWYVEAVGEGGRQIHPAWASFGPTAARHHAPHALQHPAGVLTVRVLDYEEKGVCLRGHVGLINYTSTTLMCEIGIEFDALCPIVHTSLMLSGLPLRSCLFMVSTAFFTNSSSLNSTTLGRQGQHRHWLSPTHLEYGLQRTNGVEREYMGDHNICTHPQP